MAATTPSTSSTQYETPARIKSDCIIQLRTSSIPSAVRGLFVVQDVKAGSIHLHPTGHPENGASRLAKFVLGHSEHFTCNLFAVGVDSTMGRKC